MENYKLSISSKTKAINLFRRFFKIGFIESFLVKKATGKETHSFYGKLIPSNYLYTKNSIRLVERNGIKYKLDISDVVDHYIYFGFKETGKDTLYAFIKPGMTILDIGANIGETALNFSKLTGSHGKVIGFEPDRINFDKAQHNIAINSSKNIRLYNIGLGNENTTHKLYMVNQENRGMNRILTHDSPHPFTEIIVRKLDDFCLEQELKQVDLIKIDVEGFEMKILTGASTTLKNNKPVLFIELDDENLKAQQSSASQLIDFLYTMDYKVYMAETNRLLEPGTDFKKCHYDIYAVQK